jgi:hypothetical protein
VARWSRVISFLGWRIGPWFDNTFNQKNYPNNNAADLKVRHDIVVKFIDSLNMMLKGLAAPDVLHVDLTKTLQTKMTGPTNFTPQMPVSARWQTT